MTGDTMLGRLSQPGIDRGIDLACRARLFATRQVAVRGGSRSPAAVHWRGGWRAAIDLLLDLGRLGALAGREQCRRATGEGINIIGLRLERAVIGRERVLVLAQAQQRAA